jgi:hypothetical protein
MTSNTLEAAFIPEVLATGSIVRLPDGTLAEVIWSDHREVHVVHSYLRAAGHAGAGPFYYRRHYVELATAREQSAYRAACADSVGRMLTWIPVMAL